MPPTARRALLIICTCNIWSVPTTRQKLNRKIAAGEGGNPDGSFNKSDLVNALNYMDLTNEERRAYFSIVAPTWKNPY